MTQEPDWHKAKCKNFEPELFFPDERLAFASHEIQKICDHCIIEKECLEWALNMREVGIWGGTTTKQRQKILRRVVRVHCPGCKATEIVTYTLLNVAVCTCCGISWSV